MSAEAQTDRAVNFAMNQRIDGIPTILDYVCPELHELTQAVTLKVSTLKANELQDIVDMDDVIYPNDAAFMPRWRKQAVTATVDALRDGEIWAFELVGDLV